LGTSPSFTTDIRTPKVTTASAVNLVIDTNAGTSTGNITLNTGINADIAVTPNGTGNVRLGDTTANGVITTGAAAAILTLSTNNGTNSGTIVITPGVNGNIAITPNGTGTVVLGDNTAAGTVTTGAAAANLTLHTNSGTNSGTIVITAGANNNISLTPNGVGLVNIGGTGAIKLPVGTDAQQPGQASQALAAQGQVRYNTTQSRFEGYNGSSWGQLGIAGGANTQIQFNNSGVLAGSGNFTWNNGTNTVTVTGDVAVSGTVTSGGSTLASTALSIAYAVALG
jgi:fibronectin-binding autotransporter adhesin